MVSCLSDKPSYFEIQYLNSRDSIIHFLDGVYTPKKNDNIFETGSSEGGILKAFTELKCAGIELAQYRIDLANGFMAEEITKGLVNFISDDIFIIDPGSLLINLI